VSGEAHALMTTTSSNGIQVARITAGNVRHGHNYDKL
jgi:hypothetical protein